MSRTRRTLAPAVDPKRKRSEMEVTVTLRLPRELHDRLKSEGGDRGFAAEIRRRLEASFTQTPTARGFGDLLAAIGHAASAAAEVHPPLGGEDTWAYAAFEEAVGMLLGAFRPEGEPPTPHELRNTAAMLVGLALAPLGDRGVGPFARLRAKFRNDEGEKP